MRTNTHVHYFYRETDEYPSVPAWRAFSVPLPASCSATAKQQSGAPDDTHCYGHGNAHCNAFCNAFCNAYCNGHYSACAGIGAALRPARWLWLGVALASAAAVGLAVQAMLGGSVKRKQ